MTAAVHGCLAACLCLQALQVHVWWGTFHKTCAAFQGTAPLPGRKEHKDQTPHDTATANGNVGISGGVHHPTSPRGAHPQPHLHALLIDAALHVSHKHVVKPLLEKLGLLRGRVGRTHHSRHYLCTMMGSCPTREGPPSLTPLTPFVFPSWGGPLKESCPGRHGKGQQHCFLHCLLSCLLPHLLHRLLNCGLKNARTGWRGVGGCKVVLISTASHATCTPLVTPQQLHAAPGYCCCCLYMQLPVC